MDALKPNRSPAPSPPPKKILLEGANCRAPYSPPKKYTEKDIGSRLLRVTFNRRKTTTKTKQNILREATAKSQKSKVRIAQVSLYTERPAEFTAESSDSENPKGNEDILSQTWCEPENDGRGT